MREKQILPLVVVALTSALVGVIALWTLDRVDSPQLDRPQNGALDMSSPTDVIEWKLVTTWPKGLPGLGAAPENFARRVNEASGGRLHIKVFGAGEIVPAFEVFDAVSGGRRGGARRRLLLERQNTGGCIFYRCALWYDRTGGQRLAPLWRGAALVARTLRPVWGDSLCGR